MQRLFLLIISSCVICASGSAYAQCVINNVNYAQGDADPADGCLVCDAARSATMFSSRDCSATVTTECEVPACRNGVCVALTLPAKTRCSDPVCASGEISQGECSPGGTCTAGVFQQTCNGFACLDPTTCAQFCDQAMACSVGFTCNNATQMCEEDRVGGDVGVSDMGEVDVGTPNNANNLNNANNENNANNANNVNNQNNTNGPPATSEDDGCCATTSSKSSPMLFLLFAILFGIQRRRRG